MLAVCHIFTTEQLAWLAGVQMLPIMNSGRSGGEETAPLHAGTVSQPAGAALKPGKGAWDMR